MDTDPFAKALTSATKKLDFLNRSFLRYSLSSLQAGAYLTIVGVVFWTMRESFEGAPLGRYLRCFSGWGLARLCLRELNCSPVIISTLRYRL